VVGSVRSKDTEAAWAPEGELVAAPPPDGILVSVYRACHMGLLFKAYSETNKAASMVIVIELYTTGIMMEHEFGASTTTKPEMIKRLTSRSSKQPVYSAGVRMSEMSEDNHQKPHQYKEKNKASRVIENYLQTSN
jgi:hypothetical protein